MIHPLFAVVIFQMVSSYVILSGIYALIRVDERILTDSIKQRCNFSNLLTLLKVQFIVIDDISRIGNN